MPKRKKTIMIEEGEHSIYSASAAHRTLVCPAAVWFDKEFPSKAGRKAEYGTACHQLGEIMIKNQTDRKDRHSFVGLRGQNGVLIDKRMCDMAWMYAFDVLRKYSSERLIIESKVNYRDVVKGGFGTADVISYCEHKKRLVVMDLKTGDYAVDAEGNYQLALYAIGAIETFDFGEIEHVEMRIYQPSIDRHSEWNIPIEKLMEFKKWARSRWLLANSEEIPMHPKEKACQWCKVRKVCPAKASGKKMVMTPSVFKEVKRKMVANG